MGQYFRAVILDDENIPKKHYYPHDFDSGAKLTEFGYFENPLLGALEKEIKNNPQRIVFAGDYADYENDCDDNLHGICDTIGEEITLKKLAKKAKKGFGKYEEHLSDTSSKLNNRYIVNVDKKEFVDKKNCPKDSWGMILHPLAILTAEGNNRGVGDYRGVNMDLVGCWSRDNIYVSNKKPSEEYTEIKPNFVDVC